MSPKLPGAVRAVAAAPDGSRAYVSAGRGVAVIDLNTGLVVGGLPVHGVPAALAVSPDGQRLYAARKDGLEVIDPLGIKPLGVLALAGTPLDLAVTATRAVVVQRERVTTLDLQTGRVVKHRKLAGAAGVDIDDGGNAWVSAKSRLVRLNPETGHLSGSVKLGHDGGGGVGVAPDGTKAIVAPGAHLEHVHRRAALVDLAKRKVIARPPTGGGPGRATYAPDATRLYVSDAAAKTVSVLSAFSGKRLKTVRLKGTPGPLVVQPGLALVIGSEADD